MVRKVVVLVMAWLGYAMPETSAVGSCHGGCVTIVRVRYFPRGGDQKLWDERRTCRVLVGGMNDGVA